MTFTTRWSTFSAPSRFYTMAGRLIPWFWAAAILLGLAGLAVGFAIAPTDFQQGAAAQQQAAALGIRHGVLLHLWTW